MEALDIENSNDNDESEINEKDEETITLDNSITNETKEVPVVIIHWFIILKSNKNVNINGLTKYIWEKCLSAKTDEIFSTWQIIFPDDVFPDKVHCTKDEVFH